MKQGWFDRLVKAIKDDGRSYRQLSDDAGLGINFVAQMIAKRKRPNGENIEKLLATMPSASSAEILLGLDIKEQNLEFLTLL